MKKCQYCKTNKAVADISNDNTKNKHMRVCSRCYDKLKIRNGINRMKYSDWWNKFKNI